MAQLLARGRWNATVVHNDATAVACVPGHASQYIAIKHKARADTGGEIEEGEVLFSAVTEPDLRCCCGNDFLVENDIHPRCAGDRVADRDIQPTCHQGRINHHSAKGIDWAGSSQTHPKDSVPFNVGRACEQLDLTGDLIDNCVRVLRRRRLMCGPGHDLTC